MNIEKMTIITDDKLVGINGRFISEVDLSSLPDNVHAVQWYGTYGEIEFRTYVEDHDGKPVLVKPSNQLITSLVDYQEIIDNYKKLKDKEDSQSEPEIPETISYSVTPRQARILLNRLGLLEYVESFVKEAGKEAELEWEYAGSIDKGNPLVVELVKYLGWTEEQLDTFIKEASEL